METELKLAVFAILKITNYDGTLPTPVNIGNPGEFSMLELAEKVIQMTGTSSKIVFQDLPQDDPKQRKPDIAKAKELLNWEPTTNLEQGLQKTIDYFRSIV
jgi:UDP-glucuronate decarboxylase